MKKLTSMKDETWDKTDEKVMEKIFLSLFENFLFNVNSEMSINEVQESFKECMK